MDNTKREDERRGKQGDLHAQSLALAASIRSGEIDLEEVEFAAYLGHPVAKLTLQQSVKPPEDFRVWAAGLARFGKPQMIQLLLALSLEYLPATRGPGPSYSTICEGITGYAALWVIKPTTILEGDARAMADGLHDNFMHDEMSQERAHALGHFVGLGRCLGAADGLPPSEFDGACLFSADEAEKPAWMYTAELLTAAALLHDNGRTLREKLRTGPTKAAGEQVKALLRYRVLEAQWME